MATQIQLRRGTEAEWTSANPLLASGEIAVSIDTNKIKIGNGVTYWSSLSYISLTPTEINTAIGGAVSTHSSDTTDVHGIPDTSVLATDSDLALKADLNSPAFTGYIGFDGIVDFSDSVIIGIDALPDQTGNSGKYLTTNGTDASWGQMITETPHPFAMIG